MKLVVKLAGEGGDVWMPDERLAGSTRQSLGCAAMHLDCPTSPGDFLDKVTILEIKSERITDVAKLENVRRELAALRATWQASPLAGRDVTVLVDQLRQVNAKLWDIEDEIREKEAAKAFDAEFVELARSVYRTNDRRAAIKRELNVVLGSELIEEKSYSKYE